MSDEKHPLYPYPHKRKDIEINGVEFKYNPPKLTIKDFTKRSCENCMNNAFEKKLESHCVNCTHNINIRSHWIPISPKTYTRVFKITTSKILGAIRLGTALESYLPSFMPCEIKELPVETLKYEEKFKMGRKIEMELVSPEIKEKECKECEHLPPDGFCNVIGCYNYSAWIKKKYCGNCGIYPCINDYNECFDAGKYQYWVPIEPKKKEIFVCLRHETCINKKKCPGIPCRSYSHYIEKTCHNCVGGHRENELGEYGINHCAGCCRENSHWSAKPKKISNKTCITCGNQNWCGEAPCKLQSNWIPIVPEKDRLCGNCKYRDMDCNDCTAHNKWRPKVKEKETCSTCGNSSLNNSSKTICEKASHCACSKTHIDWIPIKKKETEKICSNCGFDYKGSCQEDTDDPCNHHSLWKPKKKDKPCSLCRNNALSCGDCVDKDLWMAW